MWTKQPPIFFDGQAAEAIQLYKKALGATVEGLMTYDQRPKEQSTTLGTANVHVVLSCDDADDSLASSTRSSGPLAFQPAWMASMRARSGSRPHADPVTSPRVL